MLMYFVYILKSLKDGNYYTGLTQNLEKRLDNHNSGRTQSTRNRKPFKLIYFEKHDNLKEARSREKFLKSYKGVPEKREIIKKYNI